MFNESESIRQYRRACLILWGTSETTNEEKEELSDIIELHMTSLNYDTVNRYVNRRTLLQLCSTDDVKVHSTM